MREISEQIAALTAEVKALRVAMELVKANTERTAKIMARVERCTGSTKPLASEIFPAEAVIPLRGGIEQPFSQSFSQAPDRESAANAESASDSRPSLQNFPQGSP